uniref:Beta-glucosidase n=1 Tax=Heterorhabditis bacteriophora TaxID=37862 RepID=A0A1I7WNP5_HETBA
MIKQNYTNIPVMITENGCPDLMGEMAFNSNPLVDDHRIRYIKEHIEAVRFALREGCNVIGYTVWSLMDNFEWDDGFEVRFGLFRVNFNSLKKNRTAKKSVEFYRQFIEKMKNSTIL